MSESVKAKDLAAFAGIGIALGGLVGYINYVYRDQGMVCPKKEKKRGGGFGFGRGKIKLKRKPTDKYLSNVETIIETLEDENIEEEEEQEIVLIKLV